LCDAYPDIDRSGDRITYSCDTHDDTFDFALDCIDVTAELEQGTSH